MRTATIHSSREAENLSIRFEDPGSSDSTTVTEKIFSKSAAYARAVVVFDAMTNPPASGTWVRICSSRVCAARRTAGIQSPCGSSAVRHALAVCSALSGSPRRAAYPPALSFQRASYQNTQGIRLGAQHRQPEHQRTHTCGQLLCLPGALRPPRT